MKKLLLILITLILSSSITTKIISCKSQIDLKTQNIMLQYEISLEKLTLPLKGEVLSLPCLLNWLTINEYLMPTEEDVKIDEKSLTAIVLVSNTSSNDKRTIIINFVFVKAPFIDHKFTFYIRYTTDVSSSIDILNTDEFKNWIKEHKYNMPTAKDVEINIYTYKIFVKIADTPTKLGATIIINIESTEQIMRTDYDDCWTWESDEDLGLKIQKI